MRRKAMIRLAAMVLTINAVMLMTGCDRRFREAVLSGAFGWVAGTTSDILTAAVPVPLPG